MSGLISSITAIFDKKEVFGMLRQRVQPEMQRKVKAYPGDTLPDSKFTHLIPSSGPPHIADNKLSCLLDVAMSCLDPATHPSGNLSIKEQLKS